MSKISVSIGDDEKQGPGFFARLGRFLFWLFVLVLLSPFILEMVLTAIENVQDGRIDSRALGHERDTYGDRYRR